MAMAMATIVNAIGTAFTVQALRDDTALFGLTWSEILWFIFAIACWYIVIKLILKLNRYEKARPSLWIRSKGYSILTDPRKQVFPRRVAWYFNNTSIVNMSSKGNLAIRSIVLRLKYENMVKNVRAFAGKPGTNFAEAPEGTIGGSHLLQPDQPIEGNLVFVEDYLGNEKGLQGENDVWNTGEIVLIDNHNKEYPFLIHTREISEK